MKSEFLEYYRPDEKDLISIKNDAVFVFDACTLLDLYKFTKKDRDNMLKIINELSIRNRIWQPHQFCLEYQQHREEVIKNEVNNYDEIIRNIEKYFFDLDKVTMVKSFPKHASVKIDKIIKEIKLGHSKSLKNQIFKIEKLKKIHPNWSKKDKVNEKLTIIFSGKIGREYTDEELDIKYSEGEIRYKKFKPPGYMDSDKDGSDITRKKKFGDLIAWNQILDKAIDLQSPVVLITNDSKEDWWVLDRKKNRHGPRKELVKEMYNKTGVLFHMMDINDLIVFANENFNLGINEKSFNNKMSKEILQVNSEKIGNIEDASPLTNSSIETSESIDLKVDTDVVNETRVLQEEKKESNLPEIQV